jgi:hypothetical protein
LFAIITLRVKLQVATLLKVVSTLTTLTDAKEQARVTTIVVTTSLVVFHLLLTVMTIMIAQPTVAMILLVVNMLTSYVERQMNAMTIHAILLLVALKRP